MKKRKASRLFPAAATAGFAAVAFVMVQTPVHAAGGGGGDGGQPACSTFQGKNACQAQSHCYWSNSKNKCRTKKNQLSGSSDTTRYTQAVSLIEEGAFTDALKILWSIEKREDPKVLNYIGYSTRKLGNVEKGIEYYHRALKLDPDYVRAREYLGEGYLQIGDLDKAKEQLREIAKRCGTECMEFKKLTVAIVFHVTGEKPDVASGKTW
ncbi:MAG: tetratricopeptide repeat protein [Hyphomicrobiales bacterium]|nr:tetratricopeptide repeat protein [Hyphomicrobiales bacterium]